MTPTPPAPEKITAAELRAMIDNLAKEIKGLAQDMSELRQTVEESAETSDEIRASVERIIEGIQHAATATPPATGGQFAEMMIESIIMTYDDAGKPAYKATGTPYAKFGVRVWPEVLPTLGIDPSALHPGPNAQPAPIRARVLLKADSDTGKTSPQKVTGKA